MDYADWVLIGLIFVSTLVGLLRGFIKEVFALAVWVAAFVVAFNFSGQMATYLEGHIELPSGRTAIAFAGLFLITLIVGGLLTWLIGKLVESTGLSGTDRLFGGVFGALRGVLLVVALIVVAGFTPIPEDPWWGESRVIQSMMPLADWAASFLPESVSEYFDLYKEAEVLEAAAESIGT